MSVISSIIQTLSPDDKRSFVALLKQKNKRNDSKNITLFKLLDTAEFPEEPDVKIYGKPSKNAFHALSKRLHDSLIDFVASKSFEGETSEEMEILKLLLASRIFFEQKQYKIGFKTLQKAEQKAKRFDLYSILNEIYYTKIQYAHVNTTVELKHVIVDFKNNKTALQQEENLNLFYATIHNELFKPDRDFTEVIRKTLSQFGISITHDLTFRSLFKILEISNKAAHITRDYFTILPFVEETYTQIDTKEELVDKHLFYHIQILYYVANAYFRNKEFDTSLHYLSLMEKQMHKHQNKYYKRFFPQFTLLLTLNFNYTGNAEKAITLIEKFDDTSHKEQITYVLDLKLSLIVFYFQQQRYKEALGIFNKLYHSDQWYTEKAGILWVLKKNLVEVLLHIELDHIDLVESRVNSFRKKYGPYLKEQGERRALEFLKLTLEYYRKPEIITARSFQTKVENTLTIPPKEQEDIFEMSFYAWLKSKVYKTDLYTTTLDLIHSN
ncbi:hypothetical protein M0D21_08275 [Aquimarina sp. D1M17]|uniref:hypothetical protein n=1 Tax=Aquimarina acroporae TaxID=2937283 RepID=UPI0020BF608F|nr:hypothetical protein [Aquimarina acroporae]MCK8521561.1 hypothetical protein [Aquimarina acroporae]